MKKSKKEDLYEKIFRLDERTILETGRGIINEANGLNPDAEKFENELVDVYATTIALNQMVADRTLKTIACSVPVTNTIASIDSVNIYDPDGKMNLISNSTFSGEYGILERNAIDELDASKSYKLGEKFKLDNVVYEATQDGTVIGGTDIKALTKAFYEGKVRYCSEAKSGNIRSFDENGEVDIKNINFRSNVKSRTAYLSMTPEALMDRLIGVDSYLDDIGVSIELSNGDSKVIRLHRLFLVIAQYIANEINKDIVHTAMCVSKKDAVLDVSKMNGTDYAIGRHIARKIKDTVSDVSRKTKQLANYVVVSESVANYLSISGLIDYADSSVTASYYDFSFGETDRVAKDILQLEQDHIHSELYFDGLRLVVDKSADFDYYMVGVNNRQYNVSGIYISDQQFILPFKDFGLNLDTDGFINFGSIKLSTATDPDNFATRIMALSKYALTVYPHSDLLEEDDSRVQYTDNMTEMANKSDLIRFVGVILPESK